MIVLFVFMSTIGVMLILPGWISARQKIAQSPLILGLPIAGILFWIGLTFVSGGAEGLSNILEAFIVCVTAICSAYLKFAVFDRSIKHRSRGSLFIITILLVVIVGLKLFLPLLPSY